MLDTDSDGTDGSWPIPSLAADDRDKQTLITQQAKDESLAAIREWSQNNERGYNYQDGILVHTLESESGELCKRVVIPQFSVRARSTNLKAPLQPLPIITTPFSRVAVDLVGPLPRSKQRTYVPVDMYVLRE